MQTELCWMPALLEDPACMSNVLCVFGGSVGGIDPAVILALSSGVSMLCICPFCWGTALGKFDYVAAHPAVAQVGGKGNLSPLIPLQTADMQ